MFARTLLSALPLLLMQSASVFAYVGQWQVYGDKSRVTALIAHGGYVYAGTQGGIRRVQPGTLTQKEYGNLDGLLDPWITGFAQDADGALWAVGRDGYLYVSRKNGTGWDVHGRSYAAQSWQMNDRAILAAGSRLFLGSQKGLTLFDTKQKVSVLNLTRFGNELDLPVLSLLRRGDTLYVGTSTGVYKTRVYFADPMNPPDTSYATLADHSRWTKVALPFVPDRMYNFLAFIGGSLATYGPGTLLQAPAEAAVQVQAFEGLPLRIGTQEYSGAWSDYTSAATAGGMVFVGGNSGLAVSANPLGATPDAVGIPQPRVFPRDTIANIGANGGRVWGQSSLGIHQFQAQEKTFIPSAVWSFYSPELYQRSLRNAKVDDNGDLYIGTWGGGLTRIRDNAPEVWNAASPGGACIQEVLPNYPVVHAISQPKKNQLFFSMFAGDASEHQLVNLNTQTGQITCLPTAVPGAAAHAIEIFADTLVGVASDRGVTFVYTREGPSGPTVDSIALWGLTGSANEAWDLAKDAWDHPWTIIGDQLAFADSLGFSKSRHLTPVEAFIGTNCKHLEADPAGQLWVGCGNGLFHVQTSPAGELTAVRRYGLDDGLPSLVLYDVAIDPSNGKVWVATARGVAVFESASQPVIPRGELGAIIPYPNPLRPQHAFVIFDKLPAGSVLRIHDATGQVVRIFHPRDLRGNQAQWDGKNESRKPVRPGVYLFSITSGSTVQRGKVIVAK